MKWLKKWLGCNCDFENIEKVAYEGQQLGRRLKTKVEKLETKLGLLKNRVEKL